MHSNTYETEKEKLIRKKVPLKKVSQISEALWKNKTVNNLIKESGDPLDEYVKIFLGILGEEHYTEERFLRFFTSLMILRQEIKDDSSLIKTYNDMDPEEQATPLQALAEIMWMISIAVLSGGATTIGNVLIKKVLEGRKERKTDSLVRLILSSPILSILSSYEKGLSIEDICKQANITKEEATYFLLNFKILT